MARSPRTSGLRLFDPTSKLVTTHLSRPVAAGLLFGALILGVLLYAALLREHRGALVDDAFISFRYAARWAEGRGLTWNDGGRPVEGFSNPAWTIALGTLARMGIPPHDSAPALGLLAWMGLIASVWSLALKRGFSWPAAVLLVGGATLDVGMALWAGSGLETPSVALLLTLWMAAALRGRAIARDGRSWLSGLLLGLLGAAIALSRPEGIVWAFWGFAWLTWILWAPGPVLLGWTVGMMPVLGYAGYRWSAYRALLPNTFLAKMEPGFLPIVHGLSDLAGWAIGHAALPVGVVLVSWAARRLRQGTAGSGFAGAPTPRGWLLLPVGFLVVGMLFVLAAGGDWMGRTRYLAPVAPAFYLLVAEATERLGVRRGSVWRYALPALLVLHLGAGWLVRDRIPDYTRAGRELGVWLARNAAPTDTVAVTAAGAVPYFSGLPAYDVLGINDAEVGGRRLRHTGGWAPGHHRYRVEGLLHLRPAWIVWDFGVRVNERRLREMRVWSGDPDRLDYRRALLADPQFREGYAIERGAPASTQEAYTVFRRK